MPSHRESAIPFISSSYDVAGGEGSLRRQPAARSAFFKVLNYSSLVALAGLLHKVIAELRAYACPEPVRSQD